MKKLTDFQIEHLIENTINKKNNFKNKKLVEFYVKKWNKCESKKERYQFFNEFFVTRKKMLNEGYNQRMIDEGIFSTLLSGGLGGFKSTFKEWLAGKLVSALGVSDPGLKNAIAIGLANLSWSKDWTKILSPVKNCRYFTDVILDSVIEYYIDKGLKNWAGIGTGTLGTAFRNAISDALTDEKYVQQLEDSVGNILCSALEKIFGGGVTDTIKNVMGGASGSPSGTPTPAVS